MPKNLSVIPDVKMNPTHGRQIADAYDALKHNPNDPEVKEAYDALTSETLDQFNALREEGFQFTKMKPGDKPQTVDEVFADIKNKKLKYYPSEQGFGTGDLGDHPMLKPSGIKDEEGKDIPHNDIFRIVHDIQGHGLAGSDFSPEGEHKAFLTHRKQFSEKAHPALFTETAGQANWGAYNKKSGESNRRLIEQGRESELEFAEQKAGILPEEIVKGKWHEAKLNQKIAVDFAGNSRGPDFDAIRAFKNGEDYEGYTGRGKNRKLKFEVKNGVLKLHGHTIARNTKKGIEVSNAGFDTDITYATLKALGINARKSSVKRDGNAILHNKEINPTSGEKVLVPHSEVSNETIRVTKPTTKKRIDPRRTISEQSIFRQKVVDKELKEQGRKTKGELPLSQTTIQPKDQRLINKITGVKSKIPKETRGTEAHHIFPVHKYPGLRNNPNNAIMQTSTEHDTLEQLNPALLRKSAKLKKQLLAARLKAFTHSSSFVGNMRYDQDEQSMTGILSGKHYKWCDVSEREFDAFQGAGSKGAFFNRNIKGQHDCGSGGILSDVKSRISKLQKTAGIKPLVRKKKKGRAIKKVSVKKAMSQTAKMISADGIANKFQEFMRNNDISKLRGTFDPVNMRIIDASNSQGAIELQRLFESKSGKVGFNSITDTRKGPVTDMDIIRSQLREIEQAGGQPSIGLFDGSLEANKVLVDVSDDEILADLLESQRSTGIIDENTEFRIVDNPKYKEN